MLTLFPMLSRPLFGLQRTATWVACGGLFVLFFGLSGCSALNFNTKTRFVVDQGDNVLISTDAWTWEDGFHFQPEGTDSVVIKLDNSEAVHLIRSEKDGHYPMVTPLFPDFANPWKLLDLSLTIGGAATAAAGISQENRNVVTGVGFFTGFLNKLINLGAEKVDYIECLNLKKLEFCKNINGNFNIFLAYYLNDVRLIDNL